MFIGVVVILFGVGAILLGGLQLAGALPVTRRAGGFGAPSGYLNIATGVLLIALGALRLKGLV
jgi:hypothetical protein